MTSPPRASETTRQLNRQRNRELVLRQAELEARLAQIVFDAIQRFKQSRC